MTNLLSKLLLWLRNTALIFFVILCVFAGIEWFNHDKNEEKTLFDKRQICEKKKQELDELKRSTPIHKSFDVKYVVDKKRLTLDLQICEKERPDIDKKLEELKHKKESSFLEKYIKPNVVKAFLALLLMLATPKVLKAFLFFVLAPLALRRAPLVIVANANGSEHSISNQDTQIGAVSQSVILTPSQELLIHSDFLQTMPLHAKKRTKWLLNNKIPLSSISSGLYMLTCVECSTNDPIVVSSTNDHLPEIGIVELPEGAAFVCQPRSLVGVVYEKDRPVRITKHWRLGSLQSWLTLQLRFLVFHGPARLLIKGGRGIRMESAIEPRLLNQSATLGFSANLKYGNARSATFMPYWAGKEGLFHDLFSGTPGVYVYEEVSATKPGGVTSIADRCMDAVLKAFGV